MAKKRVNDKPYFGMELIKNKISALSFVILAISVLLSFMSKEPSLGNTIMERFLFASASLLTLGMAVSMGQYISRAKTRMKKTNNYSGWTSFADAVILGGLGFLVIVFALYALLP